MLSASLLAADMVPQRTARADDGSVSVNVHPAGPSEQDSYNANNIGEYDSFTFIRVT